MDRNDTIKRIKTALKTRSGKPWSVTGGKGTAYGWLKIDAPPSCRTWKHRRKDGLSEDASYERENWEEYDSGEAGGHMSPADQVQLKTLLGLTTLHHQGVDIMASNDAYQEYIDRAEGRTPTKIAQPYWD